MPELTTAPVETSIADADELYFNDVSETPDALNRITVLNFLGSALAALRTVFTPASTTGPASLMLHEDTDNGTNKITVQGQSALSADRTLTLPDETGTIATRAYADALVAGLSWKQAVRAATTSAGTLASSFENGDTVDGVTLATGDRILIKNQASATENGIYTVNASGAPSRATDADSGAELVNASVYVQEGTANADKQFVCTTNAPITIGATNITFTEFSSGSGIGGSTGATDNAILRADGTGGSTAQNSPVTIDDSGNITVPSATQLQVGTRNLITGNTGTFSAAVGSTSDWTDLNYGAASAHYFRVASNLVAQVDGSSTAGHTRLMIWDVDNAQLERVTVGAADSGGSGFKVLRIPN